MKKRIFPILLLILFLFLLVFLIKGIHAKTFEEKREDLLNQLHENIEEAKEEGIYSCCLDPPCTMCYMGSWIWKDGSCHCDEAMMEGNMDKVCPQCIKGLEEGTCKHTDSACPTI